MKRGDVEMAERNAKSRYGERLEELAVRVIGFAHSLPKTVAGRHISQQVLRSGTSSGANYCEAQCAESRADFAHKMQLVVKELRETNYWLKLAKRANLVKPERLNGLEDELNELIAIGVRSVVTAKKGGIKS
jgi:four helix bundle protein